jgi:hypothetical protein
MEKQFTNPKQSRKILRLGIPKDTSDFDIICSSELPCDWREHRTMFEDDENRKWFVFRSLMENRTYSEQEAIWNEHINEDFMLPSWSFGRLVEIYEICTGKAYKHDKSKSLMQDIVDKIDWSINFALFHRFRFYKLCEVESTHTQYKYNASNEI